MYQDFKAKLQKKLLKVEDYERVINCERIKDLKLNNEVLSELKQFCKLSICLLEEDIEISDVIRNLFEKFNLTYEDVRKNSNNKNITKANKISNMKPKKDKIDQNDTEVIVTEGINCVGIEYEIKPNPNVKIDNIGFEVIESNTPQVGKKAKVLTTEFVSGNPEAGNLGCYFDVEVKEITNDKALVQSLNGKNVSFFIPVEDLEFEK